MRLLCPHRTSRLVAACAGSAPRRSATCACATHLPSTTTTPCVCARAACGAPPGSWHLIWRHILAAAVVSLAVLQNQAWSCSTEPDWGSMSADARELKEIAWCVVCVVPHARWVCAAVGMGIDDPCLTDWWRPDRLQVRDAGRQPHRDGRGDCIREDEGAVGRVHHDAQRPPAAHGQRHGFSV